MEKEYEKFKTIWQKLDEKFNCIIIQNNGIVTIRYLIYAVVSLIWIFLGGISIFIQFLTIFPLVILVITIILVLLDVIKPRWQYKEIFNKN